MSFDASRSLRSRVGWLFVANAQRHVRFDELGSYAHAMHAGAVDG